MICLTWFIHYVMSQRVNKHVYLFDLEIHENQNKHSKRKENMIDAIYILENVCIICSSI